MAIQSKSLYRLCKSLVPQPRVNGRGGCLKLPKEIVRDPDPSTYNQHLEYAAGSNPTFNSPDIDSVNVWPMRPIPLIKVRVRNLSTDASANRTRVDVSWSLWGIGMARQPIASAFVDLQRYGFPGSEATIQIPTPSDAIDANRYGIFANVVHPYDRDPSNNTGEQTIDGFATSETRSKDFIIPIRNPTNSVGNIQLSVAPNLWGATIVPSTLTLGAGNQQDAQFSVTIPNSVPPSPPGTLISQTFEIMALLNGGLLGGVAIVVLIDN